MLRVRMTGAEMDRLEAAAEARGISLAELVRGAVEREIGEHPVDELRAARALRTLDEIAAANPELVGESSRDNLAAWTDILEADEKGPSEMPPKSKEPTTQVAFRLPDSLLDRLDKHVERMTDDNPGLEFTRVDAVRSLLTRALDEIEGKRKGR